MREDLISVIVPVYNDEEHIERCIRSILSQTYGNLEIIIVDDGSSDRTAQICNRISLLDDRIFFCQLSHRGGEFLARQFAIRKAKGTYIGFVDSDDWIENDYFQILHEGIKMVDVVGGAYTRDTLYTTSVSYERCRLNKYNEHNIEEFYKEIMYPNKSITPMVWNKLFKAEILREECEKVNPNLYMASDAVLTYLYMLRCKSVKIIDKAGYHYCLNKNSITESTDDCFLGNVNDFYINLKENFEKHYLADILIDNLKRYVMTLIRNRINYKLDIPKDFRIPTFYYPYFGRLESMKVILYGAGDVGKEYYERMVRDGECEVVMWVDKQYEKYQRENLPVKSPDDIITANYDVIVIGVKDKSIYESIKKELLNKNIEIDKIMWNKTKAKWE